ncbi:MAG: hypothetical protein M3Y87_35255, partial [Myxococcota bacterium]|nr:hypothetical protein [Myxococcota bacterium]
LALAGGAAYLVARWRRRAPSARAVALTQLADARRLIASHEPARFGEAVSEAIRRYLEARFDLRAPRRTTEEFLAELAQDESSPVGAQRGRLAELLAFSDAAKFGGFRLAVEEMEAMHESAVGFVEETAREADERARRAPRSRPIETVDGGERTRGAA